MLADIADFCYWAIAFLDSRFLRDDSPRGQLASVNRPPSRLMSLLGRGTPHVVPKLDLEPDRPQSYKLLRQCQES